MLVGRTGFVVLDAFERQKRCNREPARLSFAYRSRVWLYSTKRHVLLILYEILYGPFAVLYRVASWIVSLGRWERWQLAVLPHIGGAPILDLGCGPGVLVSRLGTVGWVVGVDRSERMTRMARSRGPVVRAMAQHLPFADATFGTAVSTFPAPFILDGKTAAELERTIRPGGRVVILPGVEWPRARKAPAGAGSNAAGIFRCVTIGEPDRLVQQLVYAGFRAERAEQVNAGGKVQLVIGCRPERDPA